MSAKNGVSGAEEMAARRFRHDTGEERMAWLERQIAAQKGYVGELVAGIGRTIAAMETELEYLRRVDADAAPEIDWKAEARRIEPRAACRKKGAWFVVEVDGEARARGRTPENAYRQFVEN